MYMDIKELQMREDDDMCNKIWTRNEVFNENVAVIFTLPWISIKLVILGFEHQMLLCNPSYRNIKYMVF